MLTREEAAEFWEVNAKAWTMAATRPSAASSFCAAPQTCHDQAALYAALAREYRDALRERRV